MLIRFDIHGLSMNSREDIEGIMTATKDAHKMIDAEVEEYSTD